MAKYLPDNPILSGLLFLLITGGIIYLFRQVFFVIFIIFGGILFAIFLSALVDLVQRVTRLSRTWSLAFIVFVVIISIGAGGWLTGSALGTQINRLIHRFPEAQRIIESWLSQFGWGQKLLSSLPTPQDFLPLGTGLLGNITGFFTTTVGFFAGTILIFFLGVYLAYEPETYLNGFLTLIPSTKRDRVREVMILIGQALRWWLIGRAVAMAAVGVLTIPLLWIIGIPLAPTLGLIVGVLTFIPFIGPTLAAVPAILVALVEGPYMVLYVIIIYVGVQQVENDILTPLIQKRAVFLPPAVLLSTEILIGILFGFMGILFASPIVIVAVVLIQTLYVQDVLGEQVQILGAHDSKENS